MQSRKTSRQLLQLEMPFWGTVSGMTQSVEIFQVRWLEDMRYNHVKRKIVEIQVAPTPCRYIWVLLTGFYVLGSGHRESYRNELTCCNPYLER